MNQIVTSSAYVKGDAEKMEDVILPGFRFHPTDEELVGFYLKRKIQQLPLSIELIKQLDIYKYDPWDLPSKPQSYINQTSILYKPSIDSDCVFLLIILKRLPEASRKNGTSTARGIGSIGIVHGRIASPDRVSGRRRAQTGLFIHRMEGPSASV